MSYSEFINNIKGVTKNRNHKITGSYGVYDYYKFYRKNKPKDPKYTLTESQYYSIIRMINNLIGSYLLKGEEINLPLRMGKIELRRYRIEPRLDKSGKLIYKSPIDWDSTLKLWYDDEEEFKNKTLIKIETRDNFKIVYNKSKANYTNKSFFYLNINRGLKQKIYEAAKNNEIDGFTYYNN